MNLVRIYEILVTTVSLSLYIVAYLNMALYSLRNILIIFPTDYLTTYLSSLVPRSVTRGLMAFTHHQVSFSWAGEVVPAVLNHPPMLEWPNYGLRAVRL